MYELFNEDCQEFIDKIDAGTVDLILTDPPYGLMKSLPKFNKEDITDGMVAKNYTWDTALRPKFFINAAEKILRQNGKMILFAQEPFTSDMVKASTTNVNFNQRCIWLKNDFAMSLMAKKACVSIFEDLLVFQKKHCPYQTHPLYKYFQDIIKPRIKITKEAKNIFRRRLSHAFESIQFAVPPRNTYEEMTEYFSLDKLPDYIPYDQLEEIDKKYKSTFNLPPGKKSKTNVFQYSKSIKNRQHPTEKPVALLRDLIRTYSRPGDVVLDLTMGSGSTGEAAMLEDRKFLGCELDKTFYNICKSRLSTVQDSLQ